MAALVLGICSILFGCFFVGFICGIIGLVLANKGLAAYQSNPAGYTGEGMLRAGKVTSIIGIVFGSIYVIYYIIAVVILGTAGFAWLEWMNLFKDAM